MDKTLSSRTKMDEVIELQAVPIEWPTAFIHVASFFKQG